MEPKPNPESFNLRLVRVTRPSPGPIGGGSCLGVVAAGVAMAIFLLRIGNLLVAGAKWDPTQAKTLSTLNQMIAGVVLRQNVPVLTQKRIVLTIVELIDLGLVASFDRVQPYNDAEFPSCRAARQCLRANGAVEHPAQCRAHPPHSGGRQSQRSVS
jgi:hypothetical protein